ncbi:DUF1194 domain-containing protein [Aestuariispira ectoiniformans]|uniref:DUF1194 domain-containing protein n=1 Tax=Aestuariispira ectoiniformans TaxID=2775080 RepID=UPI00223B35A7|nr:DUF1194 domain-containing protein [Aestuariispira ectoiniformans]
MFFWTTLSNLLPRGVPFAVILAASMAGGLLNSTPARAQEPVDLALVIAIDCSFSVDRVEYQKQLLGISEALRNPSVIQAIRSGPMRAVAISMMLWSDSNHQVTAIPWTRLRSEEDVRHFADLILTQPRAIALGSTSISAAITYAMTMYRTNPYPTPRQVLDISGDGRNNTGFPVEKARQAAVFSGVVINGLAITQDEPTLDIYYERNVIGGPGSFVIDARNYDDYARAMRIKMQREIGYVPVAMAAPQ